VDQAQHHNGLMDIDPSTDPPLNALPTPTASPPQTLKADANARMSVDGTDDATKVKFAGASAHDGQDTTDHSGEREPVPATDCLSPFPSTS
jgi:hypothetical protein